MMRKYDEVSINHPFSGHCVGVHIGIEKERVPSHGNGLEHKWATNVWSYLGNAPDESLEVSCGSPVLGEERNVVSFFGFLKPTGLAVGIAGSNA